MDYISFLKNKINKSSKPSLTEKWDTLERVKAVYITVGEGWGIAGLES